MGQSHSRNQSLGFRGQKEPSQILQDVISKEKVVMIALKRTKEACLDKIGAKHKRLIRHLLALTLSLRASQHLFCIVEDL